MTFILDLTILGFPGSSNALIDPGITDMRWIMRHDPPTSDQLSILPRKLRYAKEQPVPPPDFMEWGSHLILSRKANAVLHEVATEQFPTIALSDEAWPKRRRGKEYVLVYTIGTVECIDVEHSELNARTYPELPQPVYSVRDSANVNIAVRASQVAGRDLWHARPYSGGLIMCSNRLRDAWTDAGCGPMRFIKCVEV